MSEIDLFQLEEYKEEDCLALVESCQIFFDRESDDQWRIREWPFASRAAVLQEYASLMLDRDGLLPHNAFAIKLPTIPPTTVTAGVITLSFQGFDGTSGWIGTYIAPPYRGKGLQKAAKERVFATLPKSVKGLYGMIAIDNTPSLKAAQKTDYCEFIHPDQVSEHPDPVQKAFWKENRRIVIVFYHLSSLRV